MTPAKIAKVLILGVLAIQPSTAFCDDPGDSDSPRIIDQKKPEQTRLLDPVQASQVDDLERTVEHIDDAREKLKTGQMKQEDFDKDLAETKQHVAEVAAKNPASAPIQTSAARAYIQAGDYPQAEAHATQAMTLAPNDPFPITTRGLAYFDARDYPKAAADAQRALKVDPGNPVARALWLLSKDRAPEGSLADAAIPRLRHIMDTVALPPNPDASPPASGNPARNAEPRPDDDPELARYKTEEGRAFARQVIQAEKAMLRKDYLTGYGLANQAIAIAPDSPRLLAARAVCAFGLQDFRTAASDATLVLKSHPDLYPMLTTRAAAYNELGRHAEALQDAEKAVALAPGADGRPLLERAIAKEGLGEPAAGALADYRHAAELDPRFTADYEAALARLAPEQAATAKNPRPNAVSRDGLGDLAERARALASAPADYAYALFLGLAAAGFALRRRA